MKKRNPISPVTFRKSDNGEIKFFMRVVLFVQPHCMDTMTFIKLDFFSPNGIFFYKKEPAILAIYTH